MTFGFGHYTYEVAEDWFKPPNGWTFGWIAAVACDSQDRVHVYSRSEHPMVVFDRAGNFLASWGEDVLQDAHGIWIDSEDQVWCTERNTHCVRKFSPAGELLMTIGTPGQAGAEDGAPFNLPTDLDLAPNGDIYISDGYGNARVHHYSPAGELLNSWGDWGKGPGQFALSHCVRIDRYSRVWICDRENSRIQIFDLQGKFLTEWTDLAKPDTIFFHPGGGRGLHRGAGPADQHLQLRPGAAFAVGRPAAQRPAGRVRRLSARHLGRLPRRHVRGRGAGGFKAAEVHSTELKRSLHSLSGYATPHGHRSH